MDNQYKFVDFKMYCPRCKYRNRDENQKPCCDCMEVGARENSHVPECWEGEQKR